MIKKKKIAGIVPCAGLSRRMGAFKPLLPFGNGTIIRGTVKSLLDAGVSKVIVVAGYRADEIEEELASMSGTEIIQDVYKRQEQGSGHIQSHKGGHLWKRRKLGKNPLCHGIFRSGI